MAFTTDNVGYFYQTIPGRAYLISYTKMIGRCRDYSHQVEKTQVGVAGTCGENG